MEGVWLTTVAWRTEPSTRDFSSAETCCWTGVSWPWMLCVRTVNVDTCLTVADLRPGPSAMKYFLQSSARLMEGGMATNRLAASFTLNFVPLYFLEICWTRLVICCFMEMNSSSLAFSAVLSMNPTRLSRVASASWRSSFCQSSIPTFLPTTSRACCNKNCSQLLSIVQSFSNDSMIVAAMFVP